MTRKPLLFMDVDGPLSPFRAPWFPERAGEHGYQVHRFTVRDGEVYQVALDPRHGRVLGELAGAYELVWATTWGEEANRFIAPLLGLPTDLRVVPLPPHAPVSLHRRYWKADHVVRWSAGRSFAWFDDEINRATRSWLARHPDVGAHLVLRVPADRGLTDADFDALAGFARRAATT